MLLERFRFPHNYVLVQAVLIHCKEQQKNNKNHQEKSYNLSEKIIFFL